MPKRQAAPIPPDDFDPMPPNPYWEAWNQAGTLPTKNSAAGGYLYVIAFSTGIVKVGKSINPRARIRAHITSAAPYGVTVTQMWLSKLHDDFGESERLLLNLLPHYGVLPIGVEYFKVPFEDVVTAAQRICENYA